MRGAAAGAIAAAAWAAGEPVLGRLVRTPYSDVRLLGRLVTRNRAWPMAGAALHLVNGAAFGTAFELAGLRGVKAGSPRQKPRTSLSGRRLRYSIVCTRTVATAAGHRSFATGGSRCTKSSSMHCSDRSSARSFADDDLDRALHARPARLFTLRCAPPGAAAFASPPRSGKPKGKP
jgi:hypothetical protein